MPRIRPTDDAAGRRPSVRDVALRAGVSLGTVSNAINHPSKVAPDTRDRVLWAMGDLGYTRNEVASSLARGDTRTIGLVVVDLSNSLFVDIARAVQHEARNQGYFLQLSTSENDPALQDEQMRLLNHSRVSGLLVAPLHDPRDSIERSRAIGCPVVVLNYLSPDTECCRALIDNEAVGYIAARHLIDVGARRIAFAGGGDHWQPVALRRIGVHRAVAETNGAVQLVERGSDSLEASDGTALADALLADDDRPDAVLAVTDIIAEAMIDRFASRGLRVPTDVAVMGCDHNSTAWGGVVPLTSVTMEGEQLGRAAVDLLLRELREPEGTHRHQTITVQPSLVLRESTIGRAPLALPSDRHQVRPGDDPAA